MTNECQQAVIYSRVASIEQVKGGGLDAQEMRCREYAKHKNYELIEVFQDDGVSGNFTERPGMKALLQLLEQEQEKDHQTIVIVSDISRLARELTTNLQLRAAISNAGGKLESPSFSFGEDSDSQLLENMLAIEAQYQWEEA